MKRIQIVAGTSFDQAAKDAMAVAHVHGQAVFSFNGDDVTVNRGDTLLDVGRAHDKILREYAESIEGLAGRAEILRIQKSNITEELAAVEAQLRKKRGW